MSLKANIFDGYHEKELYSHLKSIWDKAFNIYPQLPFTKIFDINTLDVDNKEKEFLLKTNIDYTVCDKKDKPLMCIEFDGWSHGYNRGAEYVQIVKDSLRKKKIELKLNIAMQHLFPFYVVSYDEKSFLLEKLHLTVLDGIIGQTVAGLSFHDKVNDYVKRSQDELDKMNKDESYEYIQDLVLMAEVELEMTYDPIVKKTSEIQQLLGYQNIHKTSIRFLSKPELPEVKDASDIEGYQKRLEACKNAKWHGAEVSVETPKGKVTEQAFVRNFEETMVSPIHIAMNIAELMAVYKAALINGVKIP